MRARIDQVIPDPNQPRKTFDDEAIKELASSFESYGIISPLKVRPYGDNQYMIITGELRYQAAKQRGDREIEVGDPIEVTDQQAREMQFIENLQRSDIPPLELGEAFYNHRKKYKLTKLQLSTIIGLSDSSITDYERIYKVFPPGGKKYLQTGKMTFVVARNIARVKDKGKQQELIEIAIKKELGKATTQQIATKVNAEPDRPVADIVADVITGKAKEDEAAQAEAAKRAAGITIETPEELMRGAEALKEEAQRKAKEAMTPEEKAEEERKKLVAEARRSLDSTAKKIDRASRVMDVSQFRERLTRLEEALESNPRVVKAQLTALGEEVTEAENRAKAEAKAKAEEEKRQRKAEEERRQEERAEAKAREKYKGDKEFVREALKAMPEKEVAEMLNMVPIPDKIKKVKSLEEEFDDIMKMASKVVDSLEKLKREGKMEQLDLKRFSITLRILADCLDEFARLAEGRSL